MGPVASPSSTEDHQRRRIGGRYVIDGRLGAGAMGTVWSAFDEVLRRAVAVKELKLPPGLPAREAEAMRERMLREARALGGLSHPNIITLYDVVDADGEPLVVLEMLPSSNLATLIMHNGALTSEQAAVVGYATAAALRAAHRSGITHRDVKPANVLVGNDGRVKLTDFGIARNAADAPMTTAGLVLGSPAYIAPEVAAGQPVTPAADLWGLGATLFAAIEGRPPYDVRGEAVATITEVVDGDVPRPRTEGAVADVVAALMVKDPARRISLDEVRRRLRPLIVDPDDPLYPVAGETTEIPTVRPAADAPAPREATGSVAAPAGLLAAAPGPLPWQQDEEPAVAAPSAPARGAIGSSGVTLVLAGAVIVLVGALGGWWATRAAVGQSAMTTVTVATADVAVREHVDPSGFRIPVPEGWTERRDGHDLVTFVSPDGREKLVVELTASAEGVPAGLAGTLGEGVVTPLPAAGPLPPGGSQLVHRGAGEAARTSWLRIVPVDPGKQAGAWIVRLTAPGGNSETVSERLFTVLADGFTLGAA